jgi:CHAT domain-containing protein
VVLSACRTGLGKEVKGEGVYGMTRGFMYAGSKRVLVTLWDVQDQATARLMTDFYRVLLGPKRSNTAAALRSAQIAIWREGRWKAPYYWAAFVLQGEPK